MVAPLVIQNAEMIVSKPSIDSNKENTKTTATDKTDLKDDS